MNTSTQIHTAAFIDVVSLTIFLIYIKVDFVGKCLVDSLTGTCAVVDKQRTVLWLPSVIHSKYFLLIKRPKKLHYFSTKKKETPYWRKYHYRHIGRMCDRKWKQSQFCRSIESQVIAQKTRLTSRVTSTASSKYYYWHWTREFVIIEKKLMRKTMWSCW